MADVDDRLSTRSGLILCDNGAGDFTGLVPEDRWFTENPLFDTIAPSACYSGGDPAWFEQSLAAVSAAPLEVRLMADEGSDNEGIALTAIELYVR